MNRLAKALMVLVVAVCSSGMTASAQSCWTWGSAPGPIWPGGWDCQPGGDGQGWSCKFWNGLCKPAASPLETRGQCPNCSKPISLSSGNTSIEETDIKLPGLAGGLSLSRTWNSIWPPTQVAFQTGLFGPNWRSTYEERIFLGDDNFVKYARSDGSFWSFAGAGSLTVIAPSNVTATLTLNSADTQWTLTFQNGEQRTFNYASGSLTAIIDRNGNATQLSYDALNRLVTVADPGGRHLYFGYASDTSYLVTSVSTDVGISLSYSYDSQGRLVQVTEPDQTTLSYQYDPGSRITAVIDSNGKVLESHTYDYCGRGLTGARAGGVESVSLSYPSPACPGDLTRGYMISDQ